MMIINWWLSKNLGIQNLNAFDFGEHLFADIYLHSVDGTYEHDAEDFVENYEDFDAGDVLLTILMLKSKNSLSPA